MAASLKKTHDGFLLNPEDHGNIGVRRKRRISVSGEAEQHAENGNEDVTFSGRGIATPPSTPHRIKKRVRFSHPNPTTTTGLTPFLGRSSISSPPPSRSRRRSTPSTRWNLAVDDSPIICGTLQFAPLRQVLDGKVKRRIRRNRLSEEVNSIEAGKRNKRKAQAAELELLRQELLQRDQQIQELKNDRDLASQIDGEAGIESLNTSQIDVKLECLELQVKQLKAELQKRELDALAHKELDWERDQFDEDDAFLLNYDEDFNAEMTDIFLSTPGRRSFPSPPATVPNTPSKPASPHDTNGEASTTDHEKSHLESQLRVLQDELKTLSKTLELSNTTNERLTVKLAPFIPESTQMEDTESLDAALDVVLTQLALLESTTLDSSSRFSALSGELSKLFPTSQPGDPESILEQLHAKFRAARLELEYLTPGENTEGFENSKLLDMLVSRLRILTKKVQQQEVDIDQYHSQEISLRQQLGSRVDAMDCLQDSLNNVMSEAAELKSELHERDESISKLTNALQGYRDEVAGLETLINRLEVEHAADDAILRDEIDSTKRDADSKILDLDLKCETLEAAAEGREILMHELERRLSGAVASARALEDAFAALRDENALLRETAAETEKSHGETLALRDAKVAELAEENETQRNASSQREKAHGKDLALRDARVTELREEMGRANAALERAHGKILSLERENRGLKAQLEGQRVKYDSLQNSIDGFYRDAKNHKESTRGSSSSSRSTDSSSPTIGGATSPVVLSSGLGLLLNAGLARRRSSSTGNGKKRRRYDSAIGFLEEEDEVLEDSAFA